MGTRSDQQAGYVRDCYRSGFTIIEVLGDEFLMDLEETRAKYPTTFTVRFPDPGFTRRT